MANGCYMVPGGWTLVGVATGSTTASCFANSTATSVDEGPTGGSCSCNCSPNMPFTCPPGPISVKYDLGGTPTCGSAGVPATMNNGGMCATDMYMAGGLAPGYNSLDLEFNAPAATGGTCTASATPNTGSITYASEDTVCTPTTNCTPNMPCMPGIPGSFSVCIEQSGNQGCPGSTFTQKHVVGTGATFTCGNGCGCTATPPQCTGTMKLYTDGMCGMGEYDYAANTCQAPGGNEAAQYKSYHYVPDQAGPATCTTSGSSSATNLQLSNPQTICCAP